MYRFALKMLYGDPGKYLGIIAGIAMASILMVQQPGMLMSIFRTTYSFIADVGLPDIWVMDPMVKYVDDARAMQDTQLYRVRGVSGVDWAVPLYKGAQKVRVGSGDSVNSIIIGLDDATLIGGPAIMLSGSLADLHLPDAVIVDEIGANDRLAVTDAATGRKRPLQIGDDLEINDKRVQVVGIARTTPSFQSQPILYTTYSRAKYLSLSERKLLSFVLVKAKADETAQDVARRIADATGLAAYTAEDFKAKSLLYMLQNTAILRDFGFVVVIGFVVGAAVTGQIFYNFTLDNLRYFGVFKAMGASDRLLLTMILLQALLVGMVGYGLGAGTVAAIAAISGNGGGPQIQLNAALLIGSSSAVLLIVLLAAAISIRKVLKLEAAVVFKS